MAEEKSCAQCEHSGRCQEVYRCLSNSKVPSVATKVVVAFLVPIAVFIVSLGVFEALLGGVISSEKTTTATACGLAVGVTMSVVVLLKMLNRRIGKR